jgi:5'-methylthioadenosine phosphorylase
MHRIDVGVIGGSGLYQMEGVGEVERVRPDTPFGLPSDEIVVAEMEGVRVGFLPRHGRGHVFSPTEVPYCANLYALKALGARAVVSVSAVGSMREEIRPGDLVFPDQLIDRTKGVRPASFFESGVVAHVQFADPFCATCRSILSGAALGLDLLVHPEGTLLVMEGPQFSTRAESHLYRSWGVSVIGMTALPEAKLAREAQMCYATLAMATDYDCWHHEEEDVSVDSVIETLKRNTANAQRVFRAAVARLAALSDCPCRHALERAIITDPSRVSQDQRRRYGVLLDGVLP